ncbi:unnamed protein product [Clonostachys byssicola]|uniref:2EXR domain-containing protein n=1 Tax=Clonostachys byssicola TaxID=160290 RepID=A0A9N9XTH6_9HYPO|nr:unnamed protein product [Clonostachys byssicola]
MTATTFHKFSDLPFDLRYQIYLLATPSRLVYIQEGFPVKDELCEVKDDECFEWEYDKLEAGEAAFVDFSHQLCHGSLQFNLKLHPDLVYFSENWRAWIAESFSQPRRQTTLEEYSFTTSKTPYDPWTATPEAPCIPANRLHEKPKLAFELARETWLYSETPIPAFLHVCTESRQVLKTLGYQLAFGTRSHAPRTWFHFERDILYAPRINDDCEYNPLTDLNFAYYSSEYLTSVLSGCPWDFGRFDLDSLRSLRRLVLPGTWSPLPEHEPFVPSLHYLANMMKLLPNLKEIFLEEWEAEDIGGWLFGTVWWRIPKDSQHSRILNRAFEPRVCIPWEPIDSIGSMCWFDRGVMDGDGVGPIPDGQRYIMRTDHPLPSIAEHSRQWDRQAWAKMFRKQLQAKLQQHASYSSAIPEITFVHTCPESLSQRFLRGRHQFWQDFIHLQEAARDQSRLELVHSAIQEPRFRVNFEKIRLEARNG